MYLLFEKQAVNRLLKVIGKQITFKDKIIEMNRATLNRVIQNQNLFLTITKFLETTIIMLKKKLKFR